MAHCGLGSISGCHVWVEFVVGSHPCFKLTRQHRTILSQRGLFFLICFKCLVTDDII